MEITFEPEDSDIIVGFEPEFAVASNCTDIEKVQWNFQNGNHTRVMADVFGSPEDGRSATTYILPDLRLCDRRNESGV
ncbi:MAG TPA: hypothetical protein EYQ69_04695 [Gemmatimonadetes bacterium]|nr:hypothetical protein [Gemmatimonadota bacterium]